LYVPSSIIIKPPGSPITALEGSSSLYILSSFPKKFYNLFPVVCSHIYNFHKSNTCHHSFKKLNDKSVGIYSSSYLLFIVQKKFYEEIPISVSAVICLAITSVGQANL
jgi:hypothetical protein